MTTILRPTLFTVATCFVAQTAVGASPGYVASEYGAKTVFEAVEEGAPGAPVRSVARQLSSKRRSKHFDRVFDDDDRKALRRLRRLAKTHGKKSGRVLRRFPPVMPSDLDVLGANGLGRIAPYLVASGLKPTKVAQYSLLGPKKKRPRHAITRVADRSNAYVRVQDGKLRDAYVWAHTVEVERSVYETKDHMLFVYADDGRLERMYRLSETRMGLALSRVDLKWGPDHVTRIDLRVAEGSVDKDPITFYRMERFDAPTLVAARR